MSDNIDGASAAEMAPGTDFPGFSAAPALRF
jgi:hypothetical protein